MLGWSYIGDSIEDRMKDAFSKEVFDQITQLSSGVVLSLIGNHPEQFLSSKFHFVSKQQIDFIENQLRYCYPNPRSITMKYALHQRIEAELKNREECIGDFISPRHGELISKISTVVYDEYSKKDNESIVIEYLQIPDNYKAYNDVLDLNIFNLTHRLLIPRSLSNYGNS